jgi:hypothetical protein
MQEFMKSVEKNPFRDSCVTAFVKEKAEIARLESKDMLWGSRICHLVPARLTTAWRMSEDPLMTIAGEGYRASEVRDRTFELQEEAVGTLRGNRKLTKAKMGDALSAIKPTTDQTKVVAAVLLALKKIQTVCYDEETKTVWTMPEDIRAWSNGAKTLWVDARCEIMLEGGGPNFGRWLSNRQDDGWTIEWPVAEGSLEEIKAKAMHLGLSPRPSELGAKVKKDDWAKSLGRAEAIQKLIAN